jgi:CrcB protein
VVGANLRYLVNRGMAQWLGTGFPYGTFVVNIFGSFVIGLLAALIANRLVSRPDVVQQALIVGFLGSLTTFSSFTFETHNLLQDGEWVRAGLNITLSVAVGLLGVRLGMLAAPWMGSG